MSTAPSSPPRNIDATEQTTRRLIFQPSSEIPPRKVEWLWKPYLPLGHVVTVEGDPESGKSWLVLAIAAKASRGQFGKPMRTLYISAEDTPEEVVRPRLDPGGRWKVGCRLSWRG